MTNMTIEDLWEDDADDISYYDDSEIARLQAQHDMRSEFNYTPEEEEVIQPTRRSRRFNIENEDSKWDRFKI